MKLHKAYRVTHKTDKNDTMTFRKKDRYLRMVNWLKKDEVFNEYNTEVVFILR